MINRFTDNRENGHRLRPTRQANNGRWYLASVSLLVGRALLGGFVLSVDNNIG